VNLGDEKVKNDPNDSTLLTVVLSKQGRRDSNQLRFGVDNCPIWRNITLGYA